MASYPSLHKLRIVLAEGAGAVTIQHTTAAYSMPHDFKEGKHFMDEAFDMLVE
jgi:hypothetical protein